MTSIAQSQSIFEQLINTPTGYYIAGGTLLALVIYYVVHRQRNQLLRVRCSECNAKMKLVDETTRNQYLDEGQRKEVEIGSLRYKVWLCRKCGHHTPESRPKSYKIEQCPECNYRTVDVTTRTERASTRSRKGRERVHKKCQYCNYTNNSTRTIPRKKRSTKRTGRRRGYGSSGSSYDDYSSYDYSSSSGSSGSFGGGSSSGDGASGDF